MKAKLLLKGSCHCGSVRFTLRSAHIFPYQRCYCSICRKTQGGGGYSINLSGDARTLKVAGRKWISIYHAKLKRRGEKRAHRSTAERHFCRSCGSALWLFSPEWPELIHPFASAIDSPLPRPPQTTHLMLNYKPRWIEPQIHPGDLCFGEYSKESIAQWHARHRVSGKARKG
jgi:hypothetical protein